MVMRGIRPMRFIFNKFFDILNFTEKKEIVISKIITTFAV
jgi:hypothetical protein